MSKPYLSIIVPAYNEEIRLPSSLHKIAHFIEQQSFVVEVIIVNDGSTDKTKTVVEGLAKNYPFIDLHSVEHHGKGFAVKHGMSKAQGEFMLVCDADLATPIEEIHNFLPYLGRTYDIAIGSRELSGATRYNEPWHRHIMGRCFNALVRILVVRGIADTQAGFKCFRHDTARQMLPYQTINGWAFDVEMLHIAQKRGYRIIEIPIQWHYIERGKIRILRDTISMFRDVWHVCRNSRSGRYNY